MPRNLIMAIAMGLLVAPVGSSLASPRVEATPHPIPQSSLRLAAASPQCEKSCMATYNACADKVAKDFAAGRIDDLEPYYEVCSNSLDACRSGC